MSEESNQSSNEPGGDEDWIKEYNDGKTRWAYKHAHIWASELEEQLNVWGRFGWELIFLTPIERKSPLGFPEPANSYTATFKMPYWIEQPDE